MFLSMILFAIRQHHAEILASKLNVLILISLNNFIVAVDSNVVFNNINTK